MAPRSRRSAETEAGAVALRAWVEGTRRGLDHAGACAAAARALAADPWTALGAVARLARSQPTCAAEDLGLDARLHPVAPGDPRAVVRVAAGESWPTPDPARRRALGAFDTPRDLARRAARQALQACDGPAIVGLDPACGLGAFLLALREAGVPRLRGEDLDPVALAVAAVLVPEAELSLRDGLEPGPGADVVVGNPPFVPPERQDKAQRRALRRRFPWLAGRFDLAVPFAAAAVARVRPSGGLGLVLPAPLLVQPYGRPLRARWLGAHRVTALSAPEAFPGAFVAVVTLALRVGAGPGLVPPHGVPAEEILALPAVPLCAFLRPGDAAIAAIVHARSVPLGALCEVDTGVVAHGPGHRRADLVHDEPAAGRRPFAEARDLALGRMRWLDFAPERMHRPKRSDLFAGPKLLVPRVAAGGALRCYLDPGGLWVGHTVNVLRPRPDQPVPLARLEALVTDPLTRGLLRLERGDRLDVYPHDLAALPVPRPWLDGDWAPLAEAWGLDPRAAARLAALGHAGGPC